ncbi:hypothetical protein VSVS12_03948 [Vibrio scophthalmi]|uniref:fimbrial biogenesis chaperone n=1 Tax=Vibrio scophthalmi TaxID=45658 RepID=UPI0008094C0C|nr:molecular chaperone [Vibrio scophthalmi]ANS87648.1 hypothetical protein VSVS12_03948 [Vibrio scophthalmi]
MKHSFVIACLLLSFQSYAQLLIAPTRIVIDGSKTVTEQVIIENTGNEALRVEINSVYKPIASNDVTRNNPNVQTIEDISSKLRLSPPVIRSLKPNQRRTIRIQIPAIPDSLPDGEYRTYLQFSPTTTVPSQKSSEDKSADSSIDIQFNVHTFIPLYQAKGTPIQKMEFDCNPSQLTIVNQGKFQFSAWIESDVTDARKIVLLRESTMRLAKKNGETLTIRQDDQTLFQCTK